MGAQAGGAVRSGLSTDSRGVWTLALEIGMPRVSGCAECLTVAVLGTLNNRFGKPETQVVSGCQRSPREKEKQKIDGDILHSPFAVSE